MTEALRTLLVFGFETCGAERVFGDCDGLNIASARVMEKVGLRKVGEFEEWDRKAGRRSTTLRLALLDHEWRRLRQAER